MLSSTLQLCLHSDKAVQVKYFDGWVLDYNHIVSCVSLFWFLGGISTKCAATQWKIYFYICKNYNTE